MAWRKILLGHIRVYRPGSQKMIIFPECHFVACPMKMRCDWRLCRDLLLLRLRLQKSSAKKLTKGCMTSHRLKCGPFPAKKISRATLGGKEWTINHIWISSVNLWTHTILPRIFNGSRTRWSWGNMVASRSKVRGSNTTEVDGFFQDLKILSTSPPRGTLSWGSRVWDFRLVKEPQTWKNRPLSKI